MTDDSNRKPWPGIRIVEGKELPDTAEGAAIWDASWCGSPEGYPCPGKGTDHYNMRGERIAEGDAAWAETWGIVDRSFLGETWAPSSKPTKR